MRGTHTGIELEGDGLLAGRRVAHRDDALVTVAVEAGEAVSLLRSRTANATELDARGRNAANHLGVLKLIEVLLGPLEEVGIHQVLLIVKQAIGIIELPERCAARGHHVQIVAELCTVHGGRRDTRALFTVNRVVVVEVGKRELEVVVLDEVVVGSISIAQHVVHLVVER